jgi:DNA-binding NarL/FixJ family response regulator
MAPTDRPRASGLRLLIVDDHPVVREGLVSVLGERPEFQVTGAAGSAEDALALARATTPDVILLDLELPGMDGAAAISPLLEAVPGAGILVFTAYRTDERVLGALQAGARGYLLKGAPVEEIARAIQAVHAGGSYLEPQVAARVLAQLGGRGQAPSALTAREREVLRLVRDGLSNKQIARSLGITERTVKFHLGAAFAKLGAENRARAVAVALEKGML